MASASASAATTSGVHRLTVVRHSLHKGPNACISSVAFAVGGYEWNILYYPDGDGRAAGAHISVFLCLRNGGEQEFPASFSFSLQDPESPATEKHKKGTEGKARMFSSKKPCLGYSQYVSKADLDASGCLRKDCLVIKCAVDVLVDDNVDFPDPDLHQHIGRLLETGIGADTTVTVRGSSFMAHRCVLAARSRVLRRQLSKRKKSKTDTYSIDIDHTDPRVFEAMLHFIYNDTLPQFMHEATDEARSMARQLFVAADRHGMERLKRVCEDELTRTLDMAAVADTFALAKRNGCCRLMDSCVTYVGRGSTERVVAFFRTDGFQHLRGTAPAIADEIFKDALHISRAWSGLPDLPGSPR